MEKQNLLKVVCVYPEAAGLEDHLIRMKKLIEDFNTEHKDSIEIQATTLAWGTPFYSKVQTSAAVGEGPLEQVVRGVPGAALGAQHDGDVGPAVAGGTADE